MKRFSALLIFAFVILSFSVSAQSKRGNIVLFFNNGVGNTNITTFSNLYIITTPRIGYNIGHFICGLETNRYTVKSSYKIRDLGIFTRYQLGAKYLSFVEAKVNRGTIKSSENSSSYCSFAVTPGWNWDLKFVDGLSAESMIDIYYRDRQLQQQKMNLNLRVGLSYQL